MTQSAAAQQMQARLNADPVVGARGSMAGAPVPDASPSDGGATPPRARGHGRLSAMVRSGPLGVSWLLWLALVGVGYAVATHERFGEFRQGASHGGHIVG